MNDRMILETLPPAVAPLRALVRKQYLADESLATERLLALAAFEPPAEARVQSVASRLALAMRARRASAATDMEGFLQEYSLGTEEGVVLMCLAEALLRIPDDATADRLIQDKLSAAHWEKHLGHSHSLLVNASTWGLMLSGRLVDLGAPGRGVSGFFEQLLGRLGEPVVRLALRRAMAILGEQFVAGRRIEDALARAARRPQWRHSFDMLGEAALTAVDAGRYLEAYGKAIAVIGAGGHATLQGQAEAHSISVKLSALHPRFEFAQQQRLMGELVPRVASLVTAARDAGIGLTLDAEECERLEPLLDVFEAVYRGAGDYEGLGIAVQAYQKRAAAVVEWLAELGRAVGRRIPVRLVKGAYWDSEIKRAQERGLDGYPVFTHKSATDVSYLACARRMAASPDAIYAQFVTHNAHTAAAVLEIMREARVERFEFQRLHGMGEALHRSLREDEGLAERMPGVGWRVYSPVGSHEDLLPYLVRRLLENGANTSFLRHAMSEDTPVDSLVADPVQKLRAVKLRGEECGGAARHARIPLPRDLYPDRRNSAGVNLADVESLLELTRGVEEAMADLDCLHAAAPLLGGTAQDGEARAVCDPADSRRVVGSVIHAEPAMVERMYALAAAAQPDWDALGAEERARRLERAADLMEEERAELIALLAREGGKCVPDADAEVREAADYCRYYALAARRMGAARVLPGPTGERNELAWHGRGVFACMSPWNFPLAIFTGQVTAALAAGNAVIAKPANQTPLIASAAVKLLHRAGIPGEVLHFAPGSSSRIGAALLDDARLAGVVMTGSTESAQAIHRQLAARPGPIVPLIAETGGQNAMIVDSSALPEQAALDALRSAFNSAGQRCSALRVLFLQDEIAERVLRLLTGAMEELAVGDPALISTDVGPVIDAPSRDALQAHAARMQSEGRLLARTALGEQCAHGSFVAPQAFEIDAIGRLTREVFGPLLHVVRFSGHKLDAVVDAINATGYGLTLGVHSRIDATVQRVRACARVGNVYVNRNQIGAVVGVQPFGGEGLSGTGPKAGGPHYVQRFALERTFTVNTAAVGGNAVLLGSAED